MVYAGNLKSLVWHAHISPTNAGAVQVHTCGSTQTQTLKKCRKGAIDGSLASNFPVYTSRVSYKGLIGIFLLIRVHFLRKHKFYLYLEKLLR